MSPTELEDTIWDLENIRIVIRAPKGTQLGDYGYIKMAAGNAQLSNWLGQRVFPLVEPYEVVVINGEGARVHGRTLLANVRATYTG